MPSAAHVISLDMQAVGVDLGSVPIDEILSFRTENREAYRIPIIARPMPRSTVCSSQ
jgi:hypothetical protein